MIKLNSSSSGLDIDFTVDDMMSATGKGGGYRI